MPDAIAIRIEGAEQAIALYQRLADQAEKAAARAIREKAARVERELVERISEASGLRPSLLKKRIQLIVHGDGVYLAVSTAPIPISAYSHRPQLTGKNPTQATILAKTNIRGHYEVRRPGFINPRGKAKMPLVRDIGRTVKSALGPSAAKLVDDLLDPGFQRRIAEELAAELTKELERVR